MEYVLITYLFHLMNTVALYLVIGLIGIDLKTAESLNIKENITSTIFLKYINYFQIFREYKPRD